MPDEDTTDISETTNGSRLKPAAPKPIPRIVVVFAGSCLTGVIVAYTSKDWCCTTTSVTLLAALVIYAADYLLAQFDARRRLGRKAQLAVVLVVACVLGVGFRANRDVLFKRALGIEPPAGVTGLVVDCSLISPSGDETILLRFSASQEAIDRLVERGGFKWDEDTIKHWTQEGWAWNRLWQHVFSNFGSFGGKAWKSPEPMRQPFHYRREITPREGVGFDHTELLWDSASGRAYALYTN